MHRRPLTHMAAALALAGVVGLSGCGSQGAEEAAADPAMAPSAMSSETMGPAESASADPAAPTGDLDAMVPGAYLTLAEYRSRMAQREGTTVVYFFHAPWCPSCRATEESVTTDGLPAGLTLVKVDYDSETDLRQQYGVTQQHTFVQVDPDGGELAKWTGSTTAAQIKAETV